MSDAGRRIDVHHHIVPPRWREALERIGQDESGGAPIPRWDVESTLAMMERRSIGAAVASVSSPGIYFGDRALARRLARECNEFAARLVADHPSRFGALAILPLPDTDAALAEIEYALDTLGLDGVILQASYGEQYLGDREFDPVFDELNRRRAVALLHPTTPPGSDVPRLGLPGFVVEFVFDTTRALANLIFSGTLERCPDIELIVAHAGGTAPYLAGRFAIAGDVMPRLKAEAPRGAINYLKRLRYDTAISATPFALAALGELVAPERILFGSDHPYMTDELIGEEIGGIGIYPGFDDVARDMVERGNASRLFPRLSGA